MHYVMYKEAEKNLKATLSLFHEHTHKPQKCESTHRNGSFTLRERSPCSSLGSREGNEREGPRYL